MSTAITLGVIALAAWLILSGIDVPDWLQVLVGAVVAYWIHPPTDPNG